MDFNSFNDVRNVDMYGFHGMCLI